MYVVSLLGTSLACINTGLGPCGTYVSDFGVAISEYIPSKSVTQDIQMLQIDILCPQISYNRQHLMKKFHYERNPKHVLEIMGAIRSNVVTLLRKSALSMHYETSLLRFGICLCDPRNIFPKMCTLMHKFNDYYDYFPTIQMFTLLAYTQQTPWC